MTVPSVPQQVQSLAIGIVRECGIPYTGRVDYGLVWRYIRQGMVW